MHVFAGNKSAFYFHFFSQEPAEQCTCDQQITSAMSGSCRLFLQLSMCTCVWALCLKVVGSPKTLLPIEMDGKRIKNTLFHRCKTLRKCSKNAYAFFFITFLQRSSVKAVLESFPSPNLMSFLSFCSLFLLIYVKVSICAPERI